MGVEKSAARLVRADARLKATETRIEVNETNTSLLGRARTLGSHAIGMVNAIRYELAKETFELEDRPDDLRTFTAVDQAREILGLLEIQPAQEPAVAETAVAE